MEAISWLIPNESLPPARSCIRVGKLWLEGYTCSGLVLGLRTMFAFLSDTDRTRGRMCNRAHVTHSLKRLPTKRWAAQAKASRVSPTHEFADPAHLAHSLCRLPPVVLGPQGIGEKHPPLCCHRHWGHLQLRSLSQLPAPPHRPGLAPRDRCMAQGPLAAVAQVALG